MQCPYCLSDVDEAAVVCRTCTRDLYLFKPMMAKIAALEAQVQELSARQATNQHVEELVEISQQAIKSVKKNFVNVVGDVAKFILIPLVLLLIAHGLITIVYDLKPIYLRLISILLPFPFGYYLFKEEPRTLLPWFVATLFLAIASVIGMSVMTSVVDQTPILPRNGFEWRELLEYSTSIAFSFLTGMLLDRYLDGKVTQDRLQTLSANVKTVGGAIAAILTTLVSIYTGLKGLF